ncbi:MAG: hypothetical protein HYX65_00170 [Gemmatimonadetes bacterium]|nr:hypothetical protein [Gemmatimonadota bacterium]
MSPPNAFLDHALSLGLVLALAMPAGAQVAAVVGAQRPDSSTLEVTLRRNSNDEPSFELNRPAYVGIFELRTGVGVTHLYPGSLDQARTSSRAGSTFVSAAEAAWNRRNSTSSTDPGPRPMTGVSRLRSNRVWLIVASDRPLNISSPSATSTSLRSVDRLRTLTAATITEADVQAVLAIVRPKDPKAEVATDLLAVPPG